MIYKVKRLKINYSLLVVVTVFICIGIIIVNSANPAFTKKNVVGSIVAFMIMLGVSRVNYKRYLSNMWYIYIINLFILIIVKLPYIGYTVNNARRWIKIFGFQFQSSELSKVLLILFVAAYIEHNKETLNTFKTLSKLVILIIPQLLLVVIQPDLSTTILTAMVIVSIIFMGGLSLKLIKWVMIVCIPIFGGLLWYIQQPGQKLLHSWQQRRVLSFLNPQNYLSQESYQQLNSMLAIGSGKFWGNGLNNSLPSSVKNANYLPEPQTDFIFAILGEDLGFVGTAFILILFIVLICILFKIANNAKDTFAKLVVGGALSYIGFQAFINMGVATLLLPNTGLPLPFISYGLSSLFSTCILMGICLNISSHRN